MTTPHLPRDLGGGLLLQPASVADAEDSFAVVDAERDRLREWLPWVDGTTSADVTRAFFERVMHAAAETGELHATIRLDGGFVGHADLLVNPLQRSGEVGYWLSASAVGRGVMTRVVAELFDIGFGDLDLHRIQLQAATGNVRSRAVAERLGMHYEGIRREAEELPQGFVDLAVYSTLVHEWPGAAVALDHPHAQRGAAR